MKELAEVTDSRNCAFDMMIHHSKKQNRIVVGDTGMCTALFWFVLITAAAARSTEIHWMSLWMWVKGLTANMQWNQKHQWYLPRVPAESPSAPSKGVQRRLTKRPEKHIDTARRVTLHKDGGKNNEGNWSLERQDDQIGTLGRKDASLPRNIYSKFLNVHPEWGTVLNYWHLSWWSF